MLRITTLIENELDKDQSLNWEHGISYLIQSQGKKILFDTGQSGEFINNAKKLDVDLSDLDYVVISHSHYDHSGGLKKLIQSYQADFKLILGQDFFKGKYSLEGDIYRYTGSDFDREYLKEKNIEVEFVEDIKYLTENIMVITNFKRDPQYENTNETMYVKEDEGYKLDEFKDEVSLVVDTEKGLVVLVGCSHPGIVNILEEIRSKTGKEIYQVIGGLHLMKEDDEKINNIIDYLKEREIEKISACHCTGKQGETMLSQQMEEEFQRNSTGDILVI